MPAPKRPEAPRGRKHPDETPEERKARKAAKLARKLERQRKREEKAARRLERERKATAGRTALTGKGRAGQGGKRRPLSAGSAPAAGAKAPGKRRRPGDDASRGRRLSGAGEEDSGSVSDASGTGQSRGESSPDGRRTGRRGEKEVEAGADGIAKKHDDEVEEEDDEDEVEEEVEDEDEVEGEVEEEDEEEEDEEAAARPASSSSSSSSSSGGHRGAGVGVDRTRLGSDGQPTTSAPGLAFAADGLHDHRWDESSTSKDTFVRGKWTAEEDAHLRRHFFEHAATAHGLGEAEARRIVTEGVKSLGLHRKAFWLTVARRFRWRSVRDIFYHAQALLGGQAGEAAGWTDDDLAALRQAEERHKGSRGKWAAVSRDLGRPRGACRQQWNKSFGAAAGGSKGGWDGEEEDRLREAVAAQRAGGGASVAWVDVAAAVGTRSSSECWDKWNRTGFGAEADGRRWTMEDDASLGAALGAEDADAWNDVDWSDVAEATGGERTADECKRRVRMLARQRAGGHALGPSELAAALKPGSAARPAAGRGGSGAGRPAKRSKADRGKSSAAKRTKADRAAEEEEEEDVDGVVSHLSALLDQ